VIGLAERLDGPPDVIPESVYEDYDDSSKNGGVITPRTNPDPLEEQKKPKERKKVFD